MLCRVSGKFYDKDFTGRLALTEPIHRRLVFDRAIETWAGYVSTRNSLSLVRGVERDVLMDGLSFHQRHSIFLGEFCLGWVVDCGSSVFKAEPINHGHLNPMGEDGKMSEPYALWSDAFKVFHYSVPESCRAFLRANPQTIEHALLAAALMK